jgi:hypothetical protein
MAQSPLEFKPKRLATRGAFAFRTRLIVLMVGLTVSTASAETFTPAIDPFDPALVKWANGIFEPVPNGDVQATTYAKIAHVDYLGIESMADRRQRRSIMRYGLWNPALVIGTAGKGSSWVYDPVHHLASGTFCCEFEADFIAVASSPPPKPVPTRNLSHVHSHFGLFIGMTIREAELALGIDPVSEPRPKKRYYELSFQAGPRFALGGGFNGFVLFRDGRAIKIELGIADS